MIPPFEDNGYLPHGIHLATLDEIESRFGRDYSSSSANRVATMAYRPGRPCRIERIVLDGSFVTDAIEPNDIDCVLLIDPHFPDDASAAKGLIDGLPFLDLELVELSEFSLLTEHIFATDRNGVPKGLVEVIP